MAAPPKHKHEYTVGDALRRAIEYLETRAERNSLTKISWESRHPHYITSWRLTKKYRRIKSYVENSSAGWKISELVRILALEAAKKDLGRMSCVAYVVMVL